MANETDYRWWQQKSPDARAGMLASVIDSVKQQDSRRRDTIQHHLRLYGVPELLGFGGSIMERAIDSYRNHENDLRYNIVKSVVEAGVSRIGKNRPKATFLTNGGSWTEQRRAKRLDHYVAGNWYQTRLYQKGRNVFRSGMLLGTGALKFFPRHVGDGRWMLDNELVPVWEVLVDRMDAKYGTPRAMYHTRGVDKQVLVAKFATKNGKVDRRIAKLIEDADAPEDDQTHQTTSNQALLTEAWHLPSEPGAGDGMYMVGVSGGELLSYEWDEQFFPITMYHWNPPLPGCGFWGAGVTRDINGIQVEINRLLDKIQQSYHLFANPWVAVQIGSRVAKEHINNRIGRILEYQGTPPQVVTHQPIHPQIFDHLRGLKQDAMNQPGMSEMAVLGRKPTDLESGEALRRWNDIEDGRHADPALALEEWYMDNARVTCSMSRWMAKRGMAPETTAPMRRRSRRWAERIRWNEVDLEEAGTVTQVYPTSYLPSTPAGRVATVQEWISTGLIDKSTGLYLIDFPDVEAQASLEMVQVEVVLDAMERILDDDEPKFTRPEPYQDLALAQQLSTAAYLRAKLDRVPEERLALMRRYIDACTGLLKRANPPAPVPAMPQSPAASPMAGAPLPVPGGMAA